MQAAAESGTVVYAVAFNPPFLKPRFLEILQEMRSRYVLTYRHRATPEPGWHAIAVRLTPRSGTVKARPGYVVRRAAQ